MTGIEVSILVVGVVLGVLSACFSAPGQAVLSIPDYGESDDECTLYYQREEEEPSEFTVVIPAKEYSNEQLENMAQETFDILFEQLPGENASVEEVQSNLVLTDDLSGQPFRISWWIEKTDVITSEGVVLNENIEEPIMCELFAELSYKDYSVSRGCCVRVLPREYSGKELFEQELRTKISQCVKAADKEADEIVVPNNLLGAEIYGSIPKPEAFIIYPFLSVVTVIFMRVRKRESVKEREKRRGEDLLHAYPIFVNQLGLYLSAGMTVRTALNQLAVSWSSRREPHLTALLETLNSMLQMMKNGMPEKEAYRRFGRLCGHKEYQKLMAILIQTIELGGKGVLEKLEELETDAFFMRKEQARQKGETASTKLLLPMILLLAVIMMLLMVPGFYGMGF